MRTGRDRYLEDPQFKALVDLMVSFILKEDYTPSEMRDAAMTASLKVEMMRPVQMLTIKGDSERLVKSFPELQPSEERHTPGQPRTFGIVRGWPGLRRRGKSETRS